MSHGLADQIRGRVPAEPGVYAFFDHEHRLLYIGKSVNLRRRMSSYLRLDPAQAEPRLGVLATALRGFAWWRTRSELLALLLEDALIKLERPPINVRQQEFEKNHDLLLSNHPLPALLVSAHGQGHPHAQVLGVFHDRYAAEDWRDILHEALGVRTCSEPEPSRRCLNFDMGRCAGPCRGPVSEPDYMERVQAVRDLMDGDLATAARLVTLARDTASAGLAYERAGRLQTAMEACERLAERQLCLADFCNGSFEARDGELPLHFQDGGLIQPRVVVYQRGVSSPGPAADAVHALQRRGVAALRPDPGLDRRRLLDRAHLVCQWQRRRSRV